MWETAMISFGLGVAVTYLVSLAALRWLKKHVTAPIVVEEYKIDELETDGFKKLIVKFEDAKRHVFKFEFHPSYAHAFSDDMVRHAARAMVPKIAEE